MRHTERGNQAPTGEDLSTDESCGAGRGGGDYSVLVDVCMRGLEEVLRGFDNI